jgi:hypothetical protein
MESGDYNKKIQLAEKHSNLGSVNDYSMVGDNVLVEVKEVKESVKKDGIWMFLNTDKHNADNTLRHGIVKSLPHRFIFREDVSHGADWKNKIQIELNDRVWFTVVGSSESEKVVINNKLYYIIPYKELIVVKRDVSCCDDDRSFESVLEEDGKLYEVIMLNGYCLVQPYMMPQPTDFKIPPKHSKNCFVAFCGEPNDKYFKDNFYDHDTIHIGDDVRVNAFRGRLEDELHLSFNGSEKYMVVQRRHFCYKY